jgi:hypothetical protein
VRYRCRDSRKPCVAEGAVQSRPMGKSALVLADWLAGWLRAGGLLLAGCACDTW